MELSLPVYPLAPSTWGAGEEVTVVDVVQSPLFAEFGGTRHTSYVPVVLEPNAVEESWRVIDPIEHFWAEQNDAGGSPHLYRAGEWGPKAAVDMLARDGRFWRLP